jgi:acetoin utilization deacetylase AcuC-like enzyme
MERLALPAIRAFRPDAIVVACGFDASAVDPLGRMLATADTFRQMTRMTMALAATSAAAGSSSSTRAAIPRSMSPSAAMP